LFSLTINRGKYSQIWTIPIGGDKSSAEAVPEAEVGEFYAGRCFIILYSYMDDSKVKSISYFWEGQLASASDYIAYDHGLYERLVEKMEDEGGGPPKKIRYRQYAEVPVQPTPPPPTHNSCLLPYMHTIVLTRY